MRGEQRCGGDDAAQQEWEGIEEDKPLDRTDGVTVEQARLGAQRAEGGHPAVGDHRQRDGRAHVVLVGADRLESAPVVGAGGVRIDREVVDADR